MTWDRNCCVKSSCYRSTASVWAPGKLCWVVTSQDQLQPTRRKCQHNLHKTANNSNSSNNNSSNNSSNSNIRWWCSNLHIPPYLLLPHSNNHKQHNPCPHRPRHNKDPICKGHSLIYNKLHLILVCPNDADNRPLVRQPYSCFLVFL